MARRTDQAGRGKMAVDREFFLSFTGADRPWAEWLLAELEAVSYSSVSQLRDFVAGANFAVDMDRAARRAKRTLGVLSPPGAAVRLCVAGVGPAAGQRPHRDQAGAGPGAGGAV